MSTIQANIAALREEIRAEAAQANRDPNDISLLAVSKTQPIDAIHAALAAGQREFGENYLQDGLPKAQASYAIPPCWHFIGAIQSNKTKAIAENFDWVHSVERLKIAKRLADQRTASSQTTPINCCIQVDIAGNPDKAGLSPTEAITLAEKMRKLEGVKLRGFMAVATATQDTAIIADEFAQVEALLHKLNDQGFDLDTLSMGMSHDWRIALKYGATMIRIGTAIFGARK